MYLDDHAVSAEEEPKVLFLKDSFAQIRGRWRFSRKVIPCHPLCYVLPRTEDISVSLYVCPISLTTVWRGGLGSKHTSPSRTTKAHQPESGTRFIQKVSIPLRTGALSLHRHSSPFPHPPHHYTGPEECSRNVQVSAKPRFLTWGLPPCFCGPE